MRTRYRVRVKMAHPKQGNQVRIRKDETIIQTPKTAKELRLREGLSK